MNLSLAMLYDYRKLNNHGKSIMQYSNSHVEEWSSQYSSIDDLKDIKNKINSAKEFANYCAMDENCWEAYNFIFWAMMILVTQNIKEEKLSVICDFSRILGITKEEMYDILNVVKAIFFGKKSIKFSSNNTEYYFKKLLEMPNENLDETERESYGEEYIEI